MGRTAARIPEAGEERSGRRPERQAVPAVPSTALLRWAIAAGNQASVALLAPQGTLSRSVAGAGGAGNRQTEPAGGPGAAGAGHGRPETTGGEHGSPGTPETDFDPAHASEEEIVAEIRRRLVEGGALRELWTAFDDVPAVANRHGDLWKRSAERDRRLAEDEDVEAAFQRLVEAKALEHLSANRELVWQEMQELGVEEEGRAQADPGQLDAVRRLQQLGDAVGVALQARAVLLQVPVGYAEFDAADPQPGGTRLILFDPKEPPPRPGAPGEAGIAAYADVATHYKTVEAVIARGMAHPAIFGALEQGGGPQSPDAQKALRQLAAGDPEAAQAQFGAALRDLLAKVERAAREVGRGIDHRDLRPVHQQVLAQPPFDRPYEASIAAEVVRGHDEMKTLAALGLSLVQIVALVAAPMVAGAAAWLLPLAGAAAPVALSYREYDRLKTARQARTGAGEHDLVAQEQVDDAQLNLALDTVFAFLDGVQGLRQAAKAARQGAKAVVEHADDVARGLSRLGEVPVAQREEVLSEAMATMGAGPAIEGAGGIETVRAAAGGTGAGRRAEAFAAGLEHDLGEHLGERAAASEPLLEDAERFVATQGRVTPGRALRTLLPGRTTEAKLMEWLVQDVSQRAVKEWVGKTPLERMHLLHESVVKQFKSAGLPAPKAELSKDFPKHGAGFFRNRWVVEYSEATFTDPTMTRELLNDLRAHARHELAHAQQAFDGIRYRFAAGGSPADVKALGVFDAHAVDEAYKAHLAAPLKRGTPEFQEAERYWSEFAGTGRAAADAVQDAVSEILAKRPDLLAAYRDWQDALEALEALVARRAGKDEIDAAADAVQAAHGRYKTLDHTSADALGRYHRLAIEQNAYKLQEAAEIQGYAEFLAEARRDVALAMAAFTAATAAGAGGMAYLRGVPKGPPSPPPRAPSQ